MKEADLDSIRSYCLRKKGGVTEELPFGDDVLVMKVSGKVFLLARLDVHPSRINLKCDPERAVELRESYTSIQPGYHMNKKHWNTIILDGDVPAALVKELIDHSFDLVVASLPKSKQKKHL